MDFYGNSFLREHDVRGTASVRMCVRKAAWPHFLARGKVHCANGNDIAPRSCYARRPGLTPGAETVRTVVGPGRTHSLDMDYLANPAIEPDSPAISPAGGSIRLRIAEQPGFWVCGRYAAAKRRLFVLCGCGSAIPRPRHRCPALSWFDSA